VSEVWAALNLTRSVVLQRERVNNGFRQCPLPLSPMCAPPLTRRTEGDNSYSFSLMLIRWLGGRRSRLAHLSSTTEERKGAVLGGKKLIRNDHSMLRTRTEKLGKGREKQGSSPSTLGDDGN